MSSKTKLSILGVALFLGFAINQAPGQVYSNKEVGAKNKELTDSLKASEYPYVLPIWGAKTTKLGYNLPYSAGFGANYMYQKSELIIENLMVGFNNGPMTDISEVVRFNSAISESGGANVRPDIWLFPFLNVYGIFARSNVSTSVDCSLWVPDSSGVWSEAASFKTRAEFQATTTGFGLTPTIGVGGGFLALDMNFTWSDVPELDEPAFAFVFGPRFGKSFRFKKPDRTVAVWAGGFRLNINSGTSGSLPISDLFPTQDLQTKVDNGIAKVGDAQTQVDAWWAGLTSAEQANPINEAKYETANRALDKAGTFLNSMDEVLNELQSATVQYSLDKRPKDMWNFVIGAQYQHNKHWMVRFEYGFLGTRTQILTGLQYRFGL
jgi:hypothetical protein